MADPARARRLAVRIREVVASTLERQIKDPRLGMVTVTDARLTADLMDATVFYTVYGDDEARAASAEALESAKGVLRSQVGRQTGVKQTPSLTFVHDRMPADAAHLDDLIARTRERDAELAAASAGASPAGDADPYRHPRDEDGSPELDGGAELDGANDLDELDDAGQLGRAGAGETDPAGAPGGGR
jgi:ribosome-binding factor A